jgi:hypothetical protein
MKHEDMKREEADCGRPHFAHLAISRLVALTFPADEREESEQDKQYKNDNDHRLYGLREAP